MNSFIDRLKENDVTCTSLLFFDQRLDAQEFRALAEALADNTTVTSLGLTNTEMGTEDVLELAKALKTNSALTLLSLQGVVIDFKGSSYLLEAMKVNTTITAIMFDYGDVPNYIQKKIDVLAGRNYDIAHADPVKKANLIQKVKGGTVEAPSLMKIAAFSASSLVKSPEKKKRAQNLASKIEWGEKTVEYYLFIQAANLYKTATWFQNHGKETDKLLGCLIS